MIKVNVQAGGPGICRVSVAGDLDVCTAPAVRNVLREAVGWHARVDVDCGGLTFCDCTGLSALLAAAKAAKGAGSELRLCAVPHPQAGDGNFVSNNHMVSIVASNHVVLDSTTTGTKVLDSGPAGEIKADTQNCTIRPTP
ncbi:MULTISPECIES: STAS domain-containing protein [unclassified Streptomyces]|uniref:STAS domain-containing protein n=1 Tax=unclassified Streptomyces TaxID=2593676 RepID=UPI002E198C05|nr:MULTISPECIES: STAS domain-containing protein [unclassified Streptomyces]